MNQQAFIKPLAKGQITIPLAFRELLRINENTLFKAEIRGKAIYLEPFEVDWEGKYIRDFSDSDLKEFMTRDKLNKKTLKKIKKYFT